MKAAWDATDHFAVCDASDQIAGSTATKPFCSPTAYAAYLAYLACTYSLPKPRLYDLGNYYV